MAADLPQHTTGKSLRVAKAWALAASFRLSSQRDHRNPYRWLLGF